MNDFEEWLATSFAAVFPNLSRDEIAASPRDSFQEWESLAAITRLSLIQQEFTTDIDRFDIENIAFFHPPSRSLAPKRRGGGRSAKNG